MLEGEVLDAKPLGVELPDLSDAGFGDNIGGASDPLVMENPPVTVGVGSESDNARVVSISPLGKGGINGSRNVNWNLIPCVLEDDSWANRPLISEVIVDYPCRKEPLVFRS